MRQDEIDWGEITAARERILGQPEFLAAPRISALLTFLLDETANGRGARLKAFTIATIVYGQSAEFNPQSNSLVRVEALRLRRMLERYYSGVGADDPVLISVPRGAYLPEFQLRTTPLAEDLPEPTSRTPSPPSMAPWNIPNRMWAIPLAAMVLITSGFVWMGLSPRPQVERGSPARYATIQVGPFLVTPSNSFSSGISDLFAGQIEDVLGRFENPIVVRPGKLSLPPDYQLTGEIRSEEADKATISVRTVHMRSQEVIWSRSFENIARLNLMDSTRTIAGSISQTYGLVYSDMHKRSGPYTDAMVGMDCVNLAYLAMNRPTVGGYTNARECLERTMTSDPAFGAAFAAYSFLLTSSYLLAIAERPGEHTLDLALDAAHNAVELSSQKARGHTAQFWARFFDKRFEDAFQASEMALKLNPYSAEAVARVGAARMLRGETETSGPLLKEAAGMSVNPPGWLEFFHFLAAHLAGDNETAWRHAYRRGAAHEPLGIISRIISASEKNDTSQVLRWRNQLETDFPGFAADIASSFDRWAMAPELKARLLADLDRAKRMASSEEVLR